MSCEEFKVFSCNANMDLSKEVVACLGKTLGKGRITKFSDGEIQVALEEGVRGYDCFVVQSTSSPVNSNLMELLIMIDAMRRASAGRINAVIPYYGYARQDRKARARDPITAKLVANLITAAGADRVVTMDLHASQIQGFFDLPVDHLEGLPVLAKHFLNKKMENVVVVSPDHGSVRRTRNLAQKINAPIAIIDKRRPEANKCEVMNIIGDVAGKDCILIDDMIDTAGTIVSAIDALREKGCKKVYVCATHPVLSGPAIDRLRGADIEEIVVLNTIELPEEKMLDNLTQLSVAPLFAEAINRVHNNESLSELFE